MSRESAVRAHRVLLALILSALCTGSFAESETGRGNFAGLTERPLRYYPENGDFVITNGLEFFNRPLYCDHSAFRVDGGDKPEFSLYVPGHGGNLRIGIKTQLGAKWLNDADQIVARYRAGSLQYEIRDRLLMENRTVSVTALPLNRAKGLIVQVKLHGSWMPLELIWAFGGANGMRGRRNGDIGCESEPVSKFFQLRPEQCRSNEFVISEQKFVLRGRAGEIVGVFSAASNLQNADAMKWNSITDLLATVASSPSPLPSGEKGIELPIIVGQTQLRDGQPFYLALCSGGDNQTSTGADLPDLFSAAERHRREIVERVAVNTPDPFINAAVPALNIAADAIWDERQQSYMHGAVAWRVRLLGWRGPYTGDALGWHERTAAHFAGYARQQNTNPVPEKLSPADEETNLARNEAALHSNGDMTRSHYDMNLVGVDAFFRHLLWTGDLDFARSNWPVIERHLAWERRLFRREFGEEKLPLYEAYAAIWASDNLNYNGGGVTHASAYNYWHNKMAARVAKLIGADGASYEREADLILSGMRKYLWVGQASRRSQTRSGKDGDGRDAHPTGIGHFAEFKDYLGLQLTHPNAGLWTFYHTLDSEVPTPSEAAQMADWIDANIPRIPILEKSEKFFVLPETTWLPYQWSLNNVVVAENIHTSLGYWQANRRDTAFGIFKGTLLNTMFLGLCPGNVGAMMQHDVMRGESQRDFGDGIGITARALVEGLFGVRPDALVGDLKIVPGFPASWTHASMAHPDFEFSFRRDGLAETFSVTPKFPRPMSLRLRIPMWRSEVVSLTVNGQPVKWRAMNELTGEPRIEVVCPAAAKTEIVVHWRGDAPRNSSTRTESTVRLDRTDVPGFDWTTKLPVNRKIETVDLSSVFNDKVTQIFRNEYRSPRSPFCSLAAPKQGIGGWADNKVEFEVDDSGLRAVAMRGEGQVVLPNGVVFNTPTNSDSRNIAFVSQWENYPREITVPLRGNAARAFLLMAGSTGPMQSQFDNGEVIIAYADGSNERLALRNPTNWWPIDQDYFTDDFGFRRDGPIPPRVDLKTGQIRLLDARTFNGKGGKVPGGAATVLELPLNRNMEMKSLTIRALANEVVIGLMAVTLER